MFGIFSLNGVTRKSLGMLNTMTAYKLGKQRLFFFRIGLQNPYLTFKTEPRVLAQHMNMHSSAALKQPFQSNLGRVTSSNCIYYLQL